MRDLAKSIRKRMDVRMASEAKVAQFTFGDFNAFWSALLALIQVHTLAHELACDRDFTKFAIGTSVIRKPRATMTTLLASVAGVSNEAAEFILKCYPDRGSKPDYTAGMWRKSRAGSSARIPPCSQ